MHFRYSATDFDFSTGGVGNQFDNLGATRNSSLTNDRLWWTEVGPKSHRNGFLLQIAIKTTFMDRSLTKELQNLFQRLEIDLGATETTFLGRSLTNELKDLRVGAEVD